MLLLYLNDDLCLFSASVLQIEQFAQFIIGDRCDGINKVCSSMSQQLDCPVYDGILCLCFAVIGRIFR